VLSKLLQSRLVFVTGKGGVGKTSFSAALGMVSATQGKKTLVVEVDNFHPSLTSIFQIKPQYKPTKITSMLSICNIVWKEALEDWLYQTIPISHVVRLIRKNKIAMLFLDATPGAREIVILSKIVELCDQFDQVIVDLPASGHALGFLRVPITAIKLMRSGPIHERAKQVLKVFGHHHTNMVLVALPEEMVINETLEFWQKIHKEIPAMQPPHIVLNRASLPSLSEEEENLLNMLEQSSSQSSSLREILRAGRWEQGLENATVEAQERIKKITSSDLLFTRLGKLGGLGGGNNKIVQQMQAAITRSIQKQRGQV